MSNIDFARLCAPFAPDEIEWRVGSTSGDKTKGLALAYMDARAVMRRLDLVCGPENWQDRYPHAGAKTVCEIGIKCGDEWVWKADGAGDTDFEADKGALSDAFKRAAFRWGIGRYLYDLPSVWVEIEQRGKSHFIKKTELDRLRKSLPKPEVLPSGSRGKMEAKNEMKALSDLIHDDRQTPDEQMLDAHLGDHKDLIEQVKRDWPTWIHGVPGNEDFVGFSQRVFDRRRVLQERAANPDNQAAA